MPENDYIGVIINDSFSVDRELKKILEENKASKKFYITISDSDKLRIGKKDRIVHKVKVVSSFQINALRKQLLELEMKDGGIQIQSKQKPQKQPIWLYIIDKG